MNQLKKTLILLSVVLLSSNSLAQLKVIFKLDDLAVLNSIIQIDNKKYFNKIIKE